MKSLSRAQKLALAKKWKAGQREILSGDRRSAPRLRDQRSHHAGENGADHPGTLPQMKQALPDGWNNGEQAVIDCAGVAGKVDDEGSSPGACGRTGEDGGRDLFEAGRTHHLAEAWQFALQDGPRGFRGKVARGRPGAACGNDEIAVLTVGQLAEGGFDPVPLVGEKADDEFTVRIQAFANNALDFRAAQVLVNSRAGAVAQSHAADFHALCFSVTRTPSIRMVLSTAFIMS